LLEKLIDRDAAAALRQDRAANLFAGRPSMSMKRILQLAVRLVQAFALLRQCSAKKQRQQQDMLTFERRCSNALLEKIHIRQRLLIPVTVLAGTNMSI
jgi:hypothetical protein